ncbi:lactonase family protein [Nocardia terpenica]|uniref:lactonase family protein n=1 Tax=Nocardia terpenica TaxID=455432 RepID=UPI002FDFC3EF
MTRSAVYVSNADSGTISVLHLADDGTVTPVQTVAAGAAVMPLAIGPDRRHLYAALRSRPYSVACFDIDSGTGRLTALATIPLPDNMAYLATDRTGRYLLAASYTGSVVSVNPIGPDGVMEPNPIEVISTPPHAHSIVPDPTNRYVFATSLGGDAILQFRFDPETGRLTPNTPAFVATKPGAGPRHLAFHPAGRLAFVANELDGTVSAFEFGSDTGCLTLIDTYTILPEQQSKPWTAELRLTPDGHHLYASDRHTNTLATFRINPHPATLTPLCHTPTEPCPRGFAIAPTGHHLLAAGQNSNALTVYAIDPPTGTLTPLARHPLGRNPNWVEIIPLS